MIDRRTLVALLAAGSATVQAQPADHTTWVANVLKRMMTIQTGMTRETLLTVFTTEGGLSNRFQRTYVSQDCRYFKVDVEFDGPDRTNGLLEKPHDKIVKISRPYLQFSIND
jgi:hypothetical protein